MQRGDVGINQLDNFCKQHDITYAKTNDLNKRQEADSILLAQAKSRIFAKDSNLKEKAAGTVVLGLMGLKRKFGMGYGKKKKKKMKKKGYFKKIKKINNNNLGFGFLKKKRKRLTKKKVRHLPLPTNNNTRGGFLLPLATSAISAGASIYQTIKTLKNNEKILKEQIKRNKLLERMVTRDGRGLFLKPYKKHGGNLNIRKKRKK